jgi:hypothetical protein
MVDNNSATINALLQYALPIDATLVTGSPETAISWAVTVRAKPPAFPDISGGELALVSMDVLRSYDSRITFADVVEGLAEVGVNGIAATDDISKSAIMVAEERQIALFMLPNSRSLTSVERDINRLIVNQSAQLTQRAMDIQQQLTRLAAENRDLNSLLKIIAGQTIAVWQPVLSLVVTLLATVLVVILAGRIFRVGILWQGKTPRISEILKWAIVGE